MTDEVINELTHWSTDAVGDGLPTGNDLRAESPFYHEGAPQAFQRLWTPHRMVYIGGQNKPSDGTPAQCPFCTGPGRDDEEALIVHRGETSYVIMNLYPYNTGHLLVCPYRHISDWTEATEADWDTEYGSLDLAVRVVADLEEAVAHIARWSTGHTEAILTRDVACMNRFVAAVDSAAVMVNASTRFTDGGVFGFGAEMGISTQKLHARGPMGVEQLTSTKFVVYGSGQIRGENPAPTRQAGTYH